MNRSNLLFGLFAENTTVLNYWNVRQTQRSVPPIRRFRDCALLFPRAGLFVVVQRNTMKKLPSWQYDEFKQVGVDYEDSAEFEAYDSRHAQFETWTLLCLSWPFIICRISGRALPLIAWTALSDPVGCCTSMMWYLNRLTSRPIFHAGLITWEKLYADIITCWRGIPD